MSILDLRLPFSTAVTLFFLLAVLARYFARFLVSLGRKASLLGDAAVLAASICPGLTAGDALVLIEQITVGLNLVRGALEEPG